MGERKISPLYRLIKAAVQAVYPKIKVVGEVPVKALPSTGSLLSSPAAFCSSWQMSMRQLLVRLCAWLCTSCPSSANLLSVRTP